MSGIRHRLAGWIKRVANPTTATDLPIGMLTSPLEARGEREGRQVVESLAATPGVVVAGAALDRFLGDGGRGTLAVKKALHVALEERLRALAIHRDPPTDHGLGPLPLPALGLLLDGVAARALGIPPPRTGGRGTVVLAVLLQALALLAGSLRIAVTAPAPGAHRRYRLGAPNFADAGYWHAIGLAARDAGVAWPDGVAVLAERGYAIDPGPDLPLIRPRECGIDRRRWWRETVRPAVRLGAACLTSVLAAPGDPARGVTAWFALRLARASLDFQRVLHTVHFDCFLDVMEYAPDHAVKAALVERHGGRLVRWPHCIMDNPGASLSYLGYHLFLGTGPYESAAHGDTWAADCERRAVGFFKNDRRWFAGGRNVDPALARLIEDWRVDGGHVLAYFGPSPVPGIEAVVAASLEAAAAAAASRAQWMLVIKAKGARSLHLVQSILPSIDDARRLESEGRLLVVPYDASGHEPCPAGWLMGQMTGGVGLGSVQMESATRGKPVFSYYPVVQDTAFQAKLLECGLAHESPEPLAAALEVWMDGPRDQVFDFDWFQAQFDPYADDRALDRIVALLWETESQLRPERSLARNVA